MKALPYWFPWMMLLSTCQSYRILGLFPFQARSHFMMFEQLMKGLADEGHRVDVVSPFPQKKPYPNYTDLVTLTAGKLVLVNNMSYSDMKNLVTAFPAHAVATLCGNDVCEQLAHPELKKLAHNPPKDPPYDAVIVEVFGAHCFLVYGYLFNVPIIGASSSSVYPWINDMIGNPENFAFVPNNFLHFSSSMTFWQRFYNFVHTLWYKFYFNYMTRVQDEMMKTHLGFDDLPSVRELERNVSMILFNSHITMDGNRPMTSAFIEVGGLHVRDDKRETLPPVVEKWLNESTHGFVYFSFGSMVRIETFPQRLLDIFYSSMTKIAPIRVLLKIAKPEDLPPGLPKNVLTWNWLPQFKVLKHPNIKAFVTHGGLMGTQEAISCGVPLIGMPLFGDQFINIDRYVERKFAVKLDYETLTQKDMDDAFNAILHDPIYRENARDVSRKFLDRPLTAMDTAVFWTEYIIRHGNKALRSPAMDLAWWQIELLDIYAALLLALLITAYVLTKVVQTLISAMNPSSETKADLVGNSNSYSSSRAKKRD